MTAGTLRRTPGAVKQRMDDLPAAFEGDEFAHAAAAGELDGLLIAPADLRGGLRSPAEETSTAQPPCFAAAIAPLSAASGGCLGQWLNFLGRSKCVRTSKYPLRAARARSR